jgi:hypothetical protein
MTDLRNKMRDWMVQYKKDILEVSEQGTYRGHRYPHLLPQNSWVLNLWEGACYKAVKHFAQSQISWHDQKHNLLSSQIFCVNLFFPLREHLDILRLWLSSHLAEVREIIDLDFEYIGPDDPQDPSGYRNYLNEPGSRGQNRTSADVAITWHDDKGGTNLLLLEFKFTEPNFGECSKQGNPDQNRCLSSREIVGSPRTQCYRAQVGRPYWDIILGSDSPLRQDLLTAEAFCPFRYDFYQLMRNQLLVHCIQRDSEANYDKVEFGVMYHADNEMLMHMRRPFDKEKDPLKAWQKLLRDPDTFHSFKIQELLKTIEPKLPGDLVDWRRYLKEKYLL